MPYCFWKASTRTLRTWSPGGPMSATLPSRLPAATTVSQSAGRAATGASLGAVALAACGQAAAPGTPSSSSATQGWQQQWDSWVAGAKKEGQLVLATGPSPEARVKVPEAFKKAFGVDVEYLGGSS